MLDGFCEYLRQQGKSENTVKAYSQGMKDYMRWYEETFGKRMKVLLRPNVLDYISYLRTVKGLSNRSVNAKLASLHSFNLYLISAGYKTEMVLTKQDYLKVQSAYASPSTVTKADVERFSPGDSGAERHPRLCHRYDPRLCWACASASACSCAWRMSP